MDYLYNPNEDVNIAVARSVYQAVKSRGISLDKLAEDVGLSAGDLIAMVNGQISFGEHYAAVSIYLTTHAGVVLEDYPILRELSQEEIDREFVRFQREKKRGTELPHNIKTQEDKRKFVESALYAEVQHYIGRPQDF